jgi:hypothetical protein
MSQYDPFLEEEIRINAYNYLEDLNKLKQVNYKISKN